MRIFVDVDDVVLNLLKEWLRLYNLDYGENLKPSDIKDWYVHKFVNPKCGNKIYDYLSLPKLYDNVLPFPHALSTINYLRDELGHRIIFATKEVEMRNVSYRKFERLEQLGFNPNFNDYVEIKDKSLLLGEVLVDDGIHNVTSFVGRGLLFTRAHNEAFEWKDRVSSWDEVKSVIEEMTRV
jgi:5'(3')-deoxyribonucleotidase